MNCVLKYLYVNHWEGSKSKVTQTYFEIKQLNIYIRAL